MDRQQKIDRVANQSGRVSKVSNLEVTVQFIHADYSFKARDGELSETGQLEILEIAPISQEGPYFVGRWDQRPAQLDIDMRRAPSSAIKSFKSKKAGYAGHHTDRSPEPAKRVFDVKIETPDGTIFDGTISFSITYDVIAKSHIEMKDTISMTVTRAKPASDEP